MNTLVICDHCQSLNRVALNRTHFEEPVCGKCKLVLAIRDGVQELSGNSLRAFLGKTSLPIVVDFWGSHCRPSRAFEPVFKDMARKMAGKMILVKLNTEADPRAGSYYQVRAVPTLIVFKDGREMGRQAGALSEVALMSFLQGLITADAA